MTEHRHIPIHDAGGGQGPAGAMPPQVTPTTGMVRTLGLKMSHVPYRGGAPMTTDLIAGLIPVGIDVVTAYVPHFRSGQLRPLAVTSAQRSPLVPDVPSVLESGQRKLVLDNFFGLTGPAKLPADVVARLNAATNEVLGQTDIKKRLLELGVTETPGTPAAFTGFVRDQVTTLQPLVKSIRVTL